MLEQPAQAVGDDADGGVAESRGLALDVVGGAKQRVMRFLVEAGPFDLLPRGFEPLAFGMHPVGELVRQLGQSRFGARDRIVIRVGHMHDGFAQPVRRRDHLVVGIGLDGWRCASLRAIVRGRS